MKTIKTVGVVGAGTMGSAIAQKFAQQGFKVILADREMQYVEKGINNIKNVLFQGVERRLFSPKQVESFLANISGTAELSRLKECDLIVEAIYENFDAKFELFQKLDKNVESDTIIATNTSSYSVTELSKALSNPERFIGLHFFYHAAKNRLVEIVPGEHTSDDTIQTISMFAFLAGKDPITTADTYGFAVNRFFVPWLNEAVRLVEGNLATIAQVDKVCMKVFGIGMGPFALMNATGVPIAYHAQVTLEVYGNLYKTSELLKKQAESGEDWDLGNIGTARVDKVLEKTITERMAGVVFYVCYQILADKICTAVELNRGARIGLRWHRGPVDLMRKFGANEVERLVRKISKLYSVGIPAGIKEEDWQLEYVHLEKHDDIAVVKMSRPEDMNALDEIVVKQLDQKFTAADNDPHIRTIIITGMGKAFVAGADIGFFVRNMKAGDVDKILAFTEFGQKVFGKISDSTKKVVAVINGLALGGGLELALCADIILAVPRAVMAFPETGIGIYPGLGGTQRTPKRIGKGLTKYLIYTGQSLNASTAKEIGLIDSVVNESDMFEIFQGKKPVPSKEPLKMNERFKALSSFFGKYAVNDLLSGVYSNDYLEEEEAKKLSKKISSKAPLALKTAEKLINDAAGCASELKELKMIFSTQDAFNGLSSVGKKVDFLGR